jgi:transposase
MCVLLSGIARKDKQPSNPSSFLSHRFSQVRRMIFCQTMSILGHQPINCIDFDVPHRIFTYVGYPVCAQYKCYISTITSMILIHPCSSKMETFSVVKEMYSIEFRTAALNVYFYLNNMKKASQALNIGIGTLWRWVNLGIQPKQRKRIPFPTAILYFINAYIQQHNYCIQKDVLLAVQDVFKINVSKGCIATAFSLLGYTRKRLRKKGCAKKKSDYHERVINLENAFSNHFNNIVSVDEVGFDQRTTPMYGYSYKGTKAYSITHPTIRKRSNVIMSIDAKGMRQYSIVNSSIDGSKFSSFIDSLTWPSGTFLLMDNVAFHKSESVKRSMANKGYRALFIPPYSPDCNPIENVFSVIKNHFRKLNLQHSLNHNEIIQQSIEHVHGSMFEKCFKRSQRFIKAYKSL